MTRRESQVVTRRKMKWTMRWMNGVQRGHSNASKIKKTRLSKHQTDAKLHDRTFRPTPETALRTWCTLKPPFRGYVAGIQPPDRGCVAGIQPPEPSRHPEVGQLLTLLNMLSEVEGHIINHLRQNQYWVGNDENHRTSMDQLQMRNKPRK